MKLVIEFKCNCDTKNILKAFGVDENYITAKAKRLSEQLKTAEQPERDEEDATYGEDDIN